MKTNKQESKHHRIKNSRHRSELKKQIKDRRHRPSLKKQIKDIFDKDFKKKATAFANDYLKLCVKYKVVKFKKSLTF